MHLFKAATACVFMRRRHNKYRFGANHHAPSARMLTSDTGSYFSRIPTRFAFSNSTTKAA
jgi:hypothetical protein